MVTTSRPTASGTSTRHDTTGLPSSSTVHDPHSASSHPFLLPVSRRFSRNTSNKDS